MSRFTGARAWMVMAVLALSFTPGAAAARESGADGAPLQQHAALDPRHAADDRATDTATTEPFGMVTVPALDHALAAKWRAMQIDLASKALQLVACRAHESLCSPSASYALGMVDRAAALGDSVRFASVNMWVNSAMRHSGDCAPDGLADRGEAPVVAADNGEGDCQGYAMMKYVILREAGTPAADLRVILLRDTLARQTHAVLAVRHAGGWLVLDHRRHWLRQDTELDHDAPLFALHHAGVTQLTAPPPVH